MVTLQVSDEEIEMLSSVNAFPALFGVRVPPACVGQAAPGVGAISAVALRGDYAYCAGQTNGVVVIDVDNTSSPVWVRNVQAAVGTGGSEVFNGLSAQLRLMKPLIHNPLCVPALNILS